LKILHDITSVFEQLLKAVFFVGFILVTLNPLWAQIIVNNTISVKDLIENNLIESDNAGVEVFNITFNGVPAENLVTQQVGSFSGGAGIFEINDGILLATGNAKLAEQPNNSGSAGTDIGGFSSDSDLESIASSGINNMAVIEFDFIPTGTQLKFGYSFASEEYNEYVFSDFNDVFGFWITLPDGSKSNVAIAPDGAVVAINSVNSSLNPDNYQSNEEGTDNPLPYPNFQYDGFTKHLEVNAPVICGDTNHIKLAIADVSDGVWDSGVFLEGNFRSNIEINMDLEIFTNGDSLILY